MTVGGRPFALASVAAGALVLALVMWWPEMPSPDAGAAPPRPAPRGAQRSGDVVPDVRLEALDGAPAGPVESGRNPFRFAARRAEGPRVEPSPEPVVMPEMPPAPPRAPPGPPLPPPIPLRFIGLFDAPAQSGRIGILSDGRGNVFHAREGDIIEGRYRVVSVGAETVELSYLDGRGRQTIRLSGQ